MAEPFRPINRLHEQLVRLYEELDRRMRDRWNRSLPFGETVSDRWERARRLGFAEGASVYESSCVYGDVQVGENTWIGPFTLLDGTGRLTIGAYCSISAGVHIYTHDTVRWAVTRGKASAEKAPVSIGDGCYIGPHTVIAKGVRIGDGAVVGACSFVNRDVPAATFVAGSPAQAKGTVDATGRLVRADPRSGGPPARRPGRTGTGGPRRKR